MYVSFLTTITINPAAPLPKAMETGQWRYVNDILHPEMQSPIVHGGEVVDTCSLCMLVDAGADEVTVVRV